MEVKMSLYIGSPRRERNREISEESYHMFTRGFTCRRQIGEGHRDGLRQSTSRETIIACVQARGQR